MNKNSSPLRLILIILSLTCVAYTFYSTIVRKNFQIIETEESLTSESNEDTEEILVLPQ